MTPINIYRQYYQRKQKEAPKLAVEGNRFWSRSIITTILLPFSTLWLRNPIPHTPGLSWPTITRQIHGHRPCSKVFFWKLGLDSKVYITLKHFCYLKLATHFMCSKKLTNKKQTIFSETQKGFRDGLSYSTPQKSKETRGNAITQPRSHPIPKFYIFNGMGPRLGNEWCFPLFLHFFEEWSVTGQP